MSEPVTGRRVTFRDVLANREFRALYVAQALSVIGDQLARIAVAVLVFAHSHSALLTAASFAVSYLPWVIGGPLLSGYADRLRRRNVMIFCDLSRGALVLVLTIPHLPTVALLILVTLVALLEPPFSASRASMLPDVVGEGEPYAIAATLSNTTNNLAVVVGFAIGGFVVAALGASATVILDTLTFAASAALLAFAVEDRPPLLRGPRNMLAELREGAQVVFGDVYLRWLVVSAWLIVGAAIATESVAVPYAAAHGGGARTAGLLTAALPVGSVIGALIVGRLVHPSEAPRYLLPMALAMPAVLALTVFNPSPTITGLIWFAAGVFSAMQVVANREFVGRVPRELRGRAFGIAAAGIAASQGIGALLCGIIAQHVSPATGVADIALPVFALICVISVRAFSSSPAAYPPNEQVQTQQEQEVHVVRGTAVARPEPRIWALSAALATVAAVGLRLLGDGPIVVSRVPGWWLCGLFTIAIAVPLHFVFRRQPWAVHLEAVPLGLGLFFMSPAKLVLIRLLAVLVAHGLIRRQPLIRLVFNLASGAVGTVCAIVVFRAVVSAGTGLHVSSWPAAFLGVITDDLVSALLVASVVYVHERVWQIVETSRFLLFAISVNIINTFLALVTASALYHDTATAWAITVFVVLSIGAFRTYHRLDDRHAALDKLYAVARELGPMAAEANDLGPALVQLRRIIKAESLELAMVGADPDFATVICVRARDAGEDVEVSEREMAEEDLSMLGPVAGYRTAAPMRRLTGRRRGRRDDDRMAVPVGGGERPLAVLTAQNRSGDIGSFDHADYRLLEAAAEQLSAALEKGRLVESLRRAATRDSLTNLANLDSLRAFLATMLDGTGGGVLLLLDVDRFHEINDTLGHDAGDAILVEVARRLESAPTQGALVARVGGDQFALAIPGQAGGEVARLAALAGKSRVCGPIRFDAVSADLRVTVGMSRAPEHGSDPATLLRRAEMAMTAAKGSSSGIGEWEPGYERDGSRRLQVLAGLRQALAKNQLRVEFQPKIRIGGGEVAGFEALVRWRDPELGAVSPAEFVPLAEASGLISALTSNVLRLALEATRRWHDAGRMVGVAVNISARSLDDPVLVGQVAAMLTASGVEPAYLTLEITESSVMESQARSVDVLLQLRSLGVRLSIDDFGTGYSSLHQLRGLPVHEVKIDKAFVDEVDGDGADRAVVRAIVELAESLGLTTVAEGVEHAAQAYALDSLGVAQVQGYFYGRPMPEPAATEWLLPRSVPLADQSPET